jgi:hypothetical protein
MAFPNLYNINYYRGDTYQFNIYPQNANNQVFSLAGYEAEFTIAEARSTTTGAKTAFAAISNNNDFLQCTISATLGATLDPAISYVYDVQISKGSGASKVVYTLMTGTLTVTADVTAV